MPLWLRQGWTRAATFVELIRSSSGCTDRSHGPRPRHARPSDRIAVLASAIVAPVRGVIAVANPFIQTYFLGGRGRRALTALSSPRLHALLGDQRWKMISCLHRQAC